MIDTLLPEMQKLLHYWVLGDPSTPLETAMALILGFMGFTLVLTFVGSLLDAPLSSTGRSTGTLLAFLLPWLILSAAGNLFLAPKIESEAIRHWMPLATAILVILVFAAPATRVFQKTHYGKGIILVVLSVAGALGVVALTGGLFASLRSGGKDFGRTKARTQEMNEFLSK